MHHPICLEIVTIFVALQVLASAVWASPMPSNSVSKTNEFLFTLTNLDGSVMEGPTTSTRLSWWFTGLTAKNKKTFGIDENSKVNARITIEGANRPVGDLKVTYFRMTGSTEQCPKYDNGATQCLGWRALSGGPTEWMGAVYFRYPGALLVQAVSMRKPDPKQVRALRRWKSIDDAFTRYWNEKIAPGWQPESPAPPGSPARLTPPGPARPEPRPQNTRTRVTFTLISSQGTGINGHPLDDPRTPLVDDQVNRLILFRWAYAKLRKKAVFEGLRVPSPFSLNIEAPTVPAADTLIYFRITGFDQCDLDHWCIGWKHGKGGEDNRWALYHLKLSDPDQAEFKQVDSWHSVSRYRDWNADDEVFKNYWNAVLRKEKEDSFVASLTHANDWYG